MSFRSLDLEQQFVRHAEFLLSKVEGGGDLNRGGNINESGAPFERSFRRLFQGALPRTFDVSQGYFFNSHLHQSNEVDFLLCDEAQVMRFPPDPEADKCYVPHSSVQAMGQLKNNISGLADALKQSANALQQWRDMSREEYVAPDDAAPEPLSIVIIGRGGDEAKAKALISAAPRPRPAYVLLLEAGILYGPETTSLRQFMEVEEGEEAFFTGQCNDGRLVLMRPRGEARAASGRLLMWLFFAVLCHATRRSPGFLDTLIKSVEREYPPVFASEEPV